MNASQDFSHVLISAFQAVLAASWQGSLAIILVLLVRWALGGRAPARWHYLLWFLALARLLVPAFAMPRNPASLENIPALAHPFQYALAAGMNEAPPDDRTAAYPPAFVPESLHSFQAAPRPTAAAGRVRTPWSRWTLAALIWMIGALGLSSWFFACAAKFRRRLRREVFPVDEAIQAIWGAACRRWLRRAPPRILAADWIASPALVGLWRPTLLIPRQALSSFSSRDWENVFVHEIAHLRARDHWTQLFLLLALCAHWFNPLVWVGIRRLRADRELAADEWALQQLEGECALGYGETLLKTVAARPGNLFQPGLVGVSEDGAQMKQRLRRITAFLPGRRLYGSLAGFAALLALSALLLGQSASPPAAGSPAKPAVDQEAEPPRLSLQPPTAKERNLPEEIKAAAREGKAGKAAFLLRIQNPSVFSSNGAVSGVRALEDLFHHRELPAFTLLLDEVRKLPIGRHWSVSDQDLSSLVKDGRTDFLDALLAQRFDLDRLSRQIKSADPATAEWIQRRVADVAKQRADIDALGKAASEGGLPAMQHLLDGGADVNGVGRDDNTPLIRAVFKDRLEAAQFLLDHGAQVNKPRLPGWDYSPLCLVHSATMAELLKKAGANVHAKLFTRDVSILTYAARWSTPEVVAWFLQQGLDPKMVGDGDQTLLFGLKDARTAELLMAAGADPNATDKSGDTALCSARSAEVAQKLIDHGAKVNNLPEPLLPRMVINGSAGAMEVALKAGADHDPVTLQETLGRVIDFEQEELLGVEMARMKALLIAHGAKPTPALAAAEQMILCQGKVSVEGGAYVDRSAIKALYYEQYSLGESYQVGGSDGGSLFVRPDGALPIRLRANAETASFAVTAEGYAATYAGPFTPPLKEKIDGLQLTLTKGLSASIQTADKSGRPIAGAKIRAYYPGPPILYLADTSADASGSVVLDHIGAAPLNVRAIAAGYQADEIESIHLAPNQTYHWTLKKATPLPGQITSAATGQPIPGALIKLAGVRGPHVETYSYPETAPLLATADAQGRFELTTLRSDCRYFLFVEAPGHSGILLGDIKTEQAELKVVLGPELFVRGKVIHIPAGLIHRGELTGGDHQYFRIGEKDMSTGHPVRMHPKNGEAEFTIGPLYARPVGIRIGDKEIDLDTKDLPKSDLIIDLAPSTNEGGTELKKAAETPATAPTATVKTPPGNAASEPNPEKPAPHSDLTGANLSPGTTLGLLPITIENHPDEFSAKRFTLHIPIKAQPGAKIDPHELVIHVLFFDTVNTRTGRNVVQTGANVTSHWLNPPANWVKSDTEELAVEYQLPNPTPESQENREYFGYLVRLYYKKQLQAASAAPERLGKDYPAAATLPQEP